jgi:hypothetical protein
VAVIAVHDVLYVLCEVPVCGFCGHLLCDSWGLPVEDVVCVVGVVAVFPLLLHRHIYSIANDRNPVKSYDKNI